jgi:hypothetical protein
MSESDRQAQPAVESAGAKAYTGKAILPADSGESNFMSDRKYRQHGYQDSGESKVRSRAEVSQPKPQENTYGPRPLNMPGARTVSRCAQCGALQNAMVESDTKCSKCGLALHSCKMCTHFDPSGRFECRQAIPARVSPKDAVNSCTFYEIRQSVERETTSGGLRVNNARQAFENLFKK